MAAFSTFFYSGAFSVETGVLNLIFFSPLLTLSLRAEHGRHSTLQALWSQEQATTPAQATTEPSTLQLDATVQFSTGQFPSVCLSKIPS